MTDDIMLSFVTRKGGRENKKREVMVKEHEIRQPEAWLKAFLSTL